MRIALLPMCAVIAMHTACISGGIPAEEQTAGRSIHGKSPASYTFPPGPTGYNVMEQLRGKKMDVSSSR